MPVAKTRIDKETPRFAQIENETPRFSFVLFNVLFSREYRPVVVSCLLIVVLEIALSVFIVHRVPYTEIDWSTYMQQVECWMNGTRDYSLIVGDTGPIVYPAGHLLIYRYLHNITDEGRDIRKAQWIFVGLYMLNLIAVLRIYWKVGQLRPLMLVFLSLVAYRVHSLFMLRLFNDCIAMFIFYMAVNLLIDRRFSLACLLYSVAVSVKMNILLFAPALFFILLFNNGVWKTAFDLGLCAMIQVVVAIPFLSHSPLIYLQRAFELNRVFFFEWTVNWRFLPEFLFLDRKFHFFLLILHIVSLIWMAMKLWFRGHGGFIHLIKRSMTGQLTRIDSFEMIFALFSANFIGMVFARSLHYQFYVWYFHSLPFLLFSNHRLFHSVMSFGQLGNVAMRMAILCGVELCWNVYPSTVFSSGLLHALHLAILLLFLSDRNCAIERERDKDE